ncbi:uncharacterized protein DUF5077 [Mucilaginibacter gracilis]|uniref:Uncharacterized protein DUF5077 n=1 Tax=Mucilaginibacter gracilis TaxID=423350 RepID=A0A495JAA0_9SPHI|nr:DUF3472 domain-containing protein [Mucilaginibacter gracilis]RKR85743.1 uncharacterized protein DUF5077 [Mucilaginibacter gracilis]
MKRLFILAVCSIFTMAIVPTAFCSAPPVVIIPLGGNAWVKPPALITDDGLTNWTGGQDITSIYFSISEGQTLSFFLRLRVPQGKSTIKISVGNSNFTKQINNTGFDTVAIGNVKITESGYVKVDLQGISKTGSVFADVSDLIVKGINPANDVVFVKQGSSFHFGRRGPSVHLRYAIPAEVKSNVKWFYSEITVPVGQDVVGSYFMADGFGEGYFGMQVNSETERRVLFSVWSPFDTQDPKSIPDSLKIKLNKKGDTVHAQEFGSEGSGGQSYMHYGWQAGKTYGFLINAQPNAVKGTTTFTAWFKDVAANKWFLVASFSRPKTVKYLTSLYSFLENFEPDNGNQTRMALYGNQWIADSQNKWLEITSVTYTGDATAKANYRKDYAGGLYGGKFYLKNGGFFNNFIPLNKTFNRPPTAAKPDIDLTALP